MWLFNRKTSLLESGILEGFTDWHSHILPGVDDGVQTMEESLQILAEYEKIGIKEVWLTPHIMEDIPNTTESLRERFAELQAEYKGNIRLHLAAENMLDNLFEERLESNDLLPLGNDGKHLLVETSYFNPPIGLHDILKRIKTKGYYPVLAHPERYVYMDNHEYSSLKSSGILFQLNLFSLAGAYGKAVMDKAVRLLKLGLYDMGGCDVHRYSSLKMYVSNKIPTERVIRMLEPLRKSLL